MLEHQVTESDRESRPSEVTPDERSETGGAGDGRDSAPGTEVVAKPRRRTFSAAYKARILAEAAQCRGPGEIGRLLRREGLYSSHLSAWRKAEREGALGALAARRRGRKPSPSAAVRKELARLQRENTRLREELRKANIILEVQGKVSRLLEIDLDGGKSC